MASSKPQSFADACRSVPSWIVPVLLALMAGLVVWGGMKEQVRAAPTSAYLTEHYVGIDQYKHDRDSTDESLREINRKLDTLTGYLMKHMEGDAQR